MEGRPKKIAERTTEDGWQSGVLGRKRLPNPRIKGKAITIKPTS